LGSRQDKTERGAERATNPGKDPAGSRTSYESGKDPAGSRTSYESGKRPGGKRNERRIWEKTGREAEVRAHPGPSVWGSRPLRGNQEAPSQAGGHARCSAREAAFVRASWVGPPNRASPMRWQAARVDDFLGKDPAGSGGVGPSWSYGMGSRPLRGNQEAPSQTGGYARCSSRNAAVVRAPWVGPPNRASPMRAFAIVVGTCGAGASACSSWRPNRAAAHMTARVAVPRCGPLRAAALQTAAQSTAAQSTAALVASPPRSAPLVPPRHEMFAPPWLGPWDPSQPVLFVPPWHGLLGPPKHGPFVPALPGPFGLRHSRQQPELPWGE
jgi:hypothetical protein